MNIISFFQTHESVLVGFLLAQLLLVVILAIKYVHDKTSALDPSGTEKKLGILELLMLIIIPSISAFAFVYVTIATIGTKPVADTRSRAAGTTNQLATQQETETAFQKRQKLFELIATDLVTITATASAGGHTIPIATTSGNFANITFSWPDIEPPDGTTTVAGYYVYFGPKNPSLLLVDPGVEGTFTKTPMFTAQHLKKGTANYLVIQVRLLSGNSIYHKNLYLKGNSAKNTLLTSYTYE